MCVYVYKSLYNMNINNCVNVKVYLLYLLYNNLTY